MPKNIVMCCDGTGNEFGERKSSVIRLYETLVCKASFWMVGNTPTACKSGFA